MTFGAKDTTDLLLLAMDQSPFGFAVLDKTHTLRFANQAYRALLELPDAIAPLGMPFAEILDLLIKRGEFRGHVAGDMARQRLLQAADGISTTIERARPNGQWLQAQLRPLPDGSILQIYLNITDRVEQRWRTEGQIVDLKARISDLEEQIIRLQSR